MAISSVSVVIPVYNEEGSLPELVRELADMSTRLPDVKFEFVFVDDGSRDGSAGILKEMAAKDVRVKLIRFIRNFGQTAAMSCGIKAATGEVIVPMDADLQNDPADIPSFLTKLEEGYDCVSGWRKDRKDAMWSRKVPSWLANGLISWATGVKIHDYGCTLKAYRSAILKGTELYGEMHRFIPAYAVWSGARITEMVANHRERRHGVSKYGLSRVFKVLLDLLVVLFLTRYFNRPIHFFGSVGFLSLGLGIIAEVSAVILRIGGLHLVETPLPTVGAMFVIVGFQFILFGLMAEVLMRTYYERGHAQPFAVREMVNLESEL